MSALTEIKNATLGQLISDRPVLFPGGLGAGLLTGDFEAFSFDAGIREEHGTQYAISSSPLESGTHVTDHVQRLPLTLTVEVVLCDTPGFLVPPTPNRAKLLYEKLLALVDTRTPFDFATSLRFYTSMVVERISVPRSSDTGDVLACTMVMRQIEIATVDQAQLLADAALAMALGKQNLGSLQAEVDTAVGLEPVPVI